MDHLPKPLIPIFAYPSAPYVSLEEYDCQEFRDYPIRAGWSHDEVFGSETWERLGEESHRSFAEAKGLLQAWLYFGSLRAFFGDLVNFDDFIDEHPFKPPSIHTRNLMRIAGNFIGHTENHPLDRHALSALGHVLGIGHNVYATIVEHCTLEPNFILSIGFLLDFLDCLHSGLCQKDPDNFDLCTSCRFHPPMVLPNTASGALLEHNGRVDFLDAELAASGWCPQVVGRLRDERLSFRYYALYLGPPDDQRDHGLCTLAHCVAYQIDKSRYVHRHMEENCNCEHVGVDLEEMCSTLQSGHIPLVRTGDPMKTGNAALLNTSIPDVKYVAISHVWSDGLGNPWKNSVARCQLRKICKAIQSLPNGNDFSAFWLDTFCCPINPREMRTLAIRKMRETYQRSDVVLVLDGELEKLSLKETPLIEIAVRIFTSGWASRLWTWQEGALSTKLYILLSDGLFYFEDLFRFMAEHYDRVSPVNYSGILSGILSTYSLVRGAINTREATPTTSFHIADITDAIAGRTTSVAEDEPICVGAMMNLDLRPILDARPEDRIYAFWKQCSSIPIQVLFSRAPRLTKPGFRWAPPTLLDKSDHIFLKFGESGKPTSRGLRVRCRGFLFLDAVDRPINFSFLLRDASGKWAFQVCNPAMGMNGGGIFQAPVPDDPEIKYSHAALLIKEDLTLDSPSAFTNSALVYVYADTDGILYARRTVRTVIELTNHPLAKSLELEQWRNAVIDPERKDVERSGHKIAIHGVCHAVEWRTLSDDQEWCID